MRARVVFAVLALVSWSRVARAQLVEALPRHGNAHVEAVEFSVSGLRGATTRVRGSDHDSMSGAVMLDSRREGYGYENGASVRVANTARIGAGSGGMEWAFRVSTSGGYRAPLFRDHGPILRVGFDGFLEGNRYLWDAALEVPKAFLGYQYFAGKRLFEVGPTLGYMLLGRYATGFDSARNLSSSLDWGASGTLFLSPIHATFSFTRVETPGSPVTLFSAELCGVTKLGACADVRYLAGDVFGPAALPSTARTWMLGITLGRGVMDFAQGQSPTKKAAR